jgi:uncharacterized membrane protein YccC
LLVQVERMLPLSVAVDDRILELRRADAMTTEVATLIEDVRDWVAVTSSGGNDRRTGADRLRQRCAALEPPAAPGMAWREAMALNLLVRLSDLVVVHENCLMLRDAIATGPRDAEEQRRIHALGRIGPRAIDRDYLGALASSASAAVALFAACMAWVASGWEGGASAVMLAGVYFSLYSGFGNPTLLLRNKFIGVVVRSSLGVIYVLAVLPSIDGFPLLAASLAPVLFISGVFLTVPRYSPLAFNLIIGVFSPSIVAQRFEPGFAEYVNNTLATLSGIYFALIMMKVLQPLWLEGASRRLLRAGWVDIARGRNKAIMQWRSRMGHRIALLTMRAANLGVAGAQAADPLRDLGAGIALAQLSMLRPSLPAKGRLEASSILECATHHYRHLAGKPEKPPAAPLLEQIDSAIQAGIGGADTATQRAVTLALVSLRRNIFPAAAPMQPVNLIPARAA